MGARIRAGLPASGADRDRALARAIEGWHERHARAMPWRPRRITARRDAYTSLVSEFMLQQTQASRVAARLPAFLRRFPTIGALARARQSSVLLEWEGLGYYRRARLLHACAKEIVRRHGGRTPGDVDSLLALPGIGAYTAGAIASIVFGRREPLVDANVARVILRLEGVALPVASPDAVALAWARAGALVAACESAALLNEGLMELGGVVCAPRSPRCGECPLSRLCIAHARGVASSIPAPARAAERVTVHHAVVLARREGRLLMQQRPEKGNGARGALWAGLWQPAALERSDRAPTAAELARWLGVRRVAERERFDRLLSHRRVRFSVWVSASAPGLTCPAARGSSWKRPAEAARLPMAPPHRRILESYAGLDPKRV